MKQAVLLGLLLAGASAARAERPAPHGFGEAALGASIAAADSNYRIFAPVVFKFSLRGGLELSLTKRLAFAPEVQVDFIPVHTNDAAYRPLQVNGSLPAYSVDTPFSRYRALVGGRLLVQFGMAAAYVRFLVGVDYLTGSEEATSLGGFFGGPLRVNVRVGFSSTAFTFQPGLGVQLRFLRYAIAGLSVDLPVAFHDFAQRDAAGIQSFTALDVDLLATIGFRR